MQALEEIVKDGEPEAAQDAIYNPVAISAHMAGNQKKIDEAHGEFAKAEAYRAGGKAGEAIEHYCKAWDGASKGTAPIAPDQQKSLQVYRGGHATHENGRSPISLRRL